MKDLIEHIELLLPDHDCVVVPGLGGFVQNEVPSRYDYESDLLYPGGKEICFNARLTFNDGFLAQSYQETFGISFEESNLRIREAVQKLNDKIDQGKYVSLGRVGVLWKNDHGQLLFRSENKNFFYPDSYGLTSFSFPTLEKREKRIINQQLQPRKRKEEEFINIRLRRNSFRNILTGAAACLFMLLLPKPAGELSGSNSQEAFMMHDYLVSSSETSGEKADTLSVLDVTAPASESMDSSFAVKPTSDGNAVVKPKDNLREPLMTDVKRIEKKEIKAAVQAENKPVQKEIQKSVASGSAYYIVVSSFPRRKLAEEWIQSNSHGAASGFSGIIEKDGRARVYARSFTDKKAAQKFLNQFRSSHPEYGSAWLLCAKNI